MATDDTILIEDSLTRRDSALAVGLKIPWYRSLWLSSVSDVVVSISGAEVPRDTLRAELNGKSWTIVPAPRATTYLAPPQFARSVHA